MNAKTMSINMSRRYNGFRTRTDLRKCIVVGIALLLVVFSAVCSFVAAVAAELSSPEPDSVTRRSVDIAGSTPTMGVSDTPGQTSLSEKCCASSDLT